MEENWGNSLKNQNLKDNLQNLFLFPSQTLNEIIFKKFSNQMLFLSFGYGTRNETRRKRRR